MGVVSFQNSKSSPPIHGEGGLLRKGVLLSGPSLTLLFFVLSMSLSSSLMAQRGFHIGGSIGGQQSWLLNQRESENPDLNRLFTPGIRGGGELAFHITPRLGVGTEFFFSLQGQRYERDKRLDEQRSSVRVLYFKVPLKLELRTELGSGSYFRFGFGPYLSSPTSVSRTRDGSAVQLSDGRSWSEAYRSPVIGGMIGLGPGMRWGGGWAGSLGLRFDHDFTNAEEKASPLIPNHRPETYNATLGLTLHVRYAFQEQAARRKSGYP